MYDTDNDYLATKRIRLRYLFLIIIKKLLLNVKLTGKCLSSIKTHIQFIIRLNQIFLDNL